MKLIKNCVSVTCTVALTGMCVVATGVTVALVLYLIKILGA